MIAHGLSTTSHLLLACASGDHSAWEPLFHRLQPSIRECATRVVRKYGLAITDADDLEGSVWVRLLSSASHFAPSIGRARGYIVTVARNTFTDELRKLFRGDARGRGGDGSGEELEEKFATMADDFAKALDLQLLKSLVQEWLETRSKAEQTLFGAAVVEQWEGQKVAELLGVSVGTMYQRKSRLLKELRESLAPSGYSREDLE